MIFDEMIIQTLAVELFCVIIHLRLMMMWAYTIVMSQEELGRLRLVVWFFESGRK